MDTGEDIGYVKAVVGKRITVEIPKGGGCETCGMRGLCGTSNTNTVLHFDTDGSYKVGDKVLVDVSTKVRLLSSLLVFGLPLIALFAFFLLARNFVAEPAAALTGFVGMVLAFLLVRVFDKKIAKHIDFKLGGKCEDLPE